MKFSILDKINYILRGKLPMGRETFFTDSPNAQRDFIANSLSVDKLHSVLRAAERGYCEELFDLYRDIIVCDSHIQTEFGKRKIAVLNENISVQAADSKDTADVETAKIVQDMLDNISNRETVLSSLLDSTLWPFSVCEKIFKPSYRKNLRYELDKIIPVPYKLIDLRDGTIRIYKEENGRITTESSFANPARYIIHRGNILTTPSYWGGPMRALLFWWLFSTMNIGWWAEFMEKFGTPFMVGKYDQNDNESRSVLSRAFATVQRLGGLVITKDTQIEVQNALSSQNGDSYEKFLAVCNREKSKLILGQTLSAESQATGLGSGVADAHEAVRADIKAFDCAMLSRTLREQLVKPFCEFNGLSGKVNIIIGKDSVNDIANLATLLTSITTSGLRPTDEAIEIISRWIGFGVERAPQPTLPMGFSSKLNAFSAEAPTQIKNAIDANAEIARKTSAEIAQNFGNSTAVIQKILEESTSANDFENKLKAFCLNWPPAQITALVQSALASNVLNIRNSKAQ